METVQIRLPKKELEEVDNKVKTGYYHSRSEAIRDMIRRVELFEVMSQFMNLAKEEGLTRKDIQIEKPRKIRKKSK